MRNDRKKKSVQFLVELNHLHAKYIEKFILPAISNVARKDLQELAKHSLPFCSLFLLDEMPR